MPSLQFQEGRTQRGGRSWWDTGRALATEESDDCLVCKVLSLVGEGVTTEDIEKKIDSHTLPFGRKSLRAFIGKARPGKALKKPPNFRRESAIGDLSQRRSDQLSRLGV